MVSLISRTLVRLALLAALAFVPAAPPQTPSSPLLGTWTGEVHYGAEPKAMGLRFAFVKGDRLGAYFELPHMRFHDYGPIPVTEKDGAYDAYVLFFRISPDGNTISGKWSFDGNDLPFEAHRGPLPPQPAPPTFTAPVAQPAWTFKTPSPIWSSPAVAGDAVYFGGFDGVVYGLKASSGSLLWQFKAGGPFYGAPTVNGSFLYILSDDGFLYKLDLGTGSLAWKFGTHGGGVARELPNIKSDVYDFVASAPAVAEGTVYIGSADKRLYAVDVDSGAEKWHFDTGSIVRSTPAVDHGRIFFGSRDHFVYAVDAKSGALAWKYDTRREVVSSPLVAGGSAYIGSRCSNLFSLDAATGQVNWKFFYWSSWVESSARERDHALYIGSSDSQQLYAIHAATGQQVWSFNTDGSPWGTPAVTEHRVYIGAVGVPNYFVPHHGAFFAVDRATGKAVWRFPMPEIPGADTYGVATSPAVGHGLVFFGGLDGTFYAFKAES
jgi:outer membrane protein assembly factor BamB